MTSIPKTLPEELVVFFEDPPFLGKKEKSKELLKGFLEYIKGIKSDTTPTRSEEEFLGFRTSIHYCFKILDNKFKTDNLHDDTKNYCKDIMFTFLKNEDLKHYFGNIKIEDSSDYDGIESFINHLKDTYNELIADYYSRENAYKSRALDRMLDNRI